MSDQFIRIPAASLEAEFYRVLLKHDFTVDKAKTIARVFTDNSIDGVYSHGFNRFPKFISVVEKGIVVPGNEAVCTSKGGNIEQWDGKSGPGIVNALMCTDRAVEMARSGGIGCVALARTNHWMRGGTYGWRAAHEGCVFIGWSNTVANTPAWGAVDPRLGNNPFVLAVPHKDEAIVLDMAMSQYSYGALEMYSHKKQTLPVPGGYDSAGNLSTDPGAIHKAVRALPIGYWKGSGLSFLLDVVAVALSGGLSVSAITAQGAEYNLSQIFIAIDVSRLANFPSMAHAIDNIIEDLKQSKPAEPGKSVRYPGEQVLTLRAYNSANGIPIPEALWAQIKSL